MKIGSKYMSNPFISICIPAYKRVHYLKRLLNSIEIQNFKDFEVIISDDSDDDSVLELVNQFKSTFAIHYFKNSPALGTPANWNYAISKAKGEWIKLIHDDDWFANKNSLQQFADATQNANKFIFSAYSNFIETSNAYQKVLFITNAKNRIIKTPLLLLTRNVIGPPSVTLFHKSIKEQYDERMKWRVDLEYYIRLILQEKDFLFINEPLINVGVSSSQVTNDCLNIPSVEIPEMYILLTKYGTSPLKNISVYDAYWRIIRNCKINSTKELMSFGQTKWPVAIENMVKIQSYFHSSFLKQGIISKLLMTISYFINRIQSKL